MSREFSLEELADSVQAWCEKHRILPANGQAAEEITERNIRYYRTLGLLDPPIGNYAKTFSDKHRLQLIAIRIFQAQGLPLRKIRDELYGQSIEDLIDLEKQVSKRGAKFMSFAEPFAPPAQTEAWSVTSLAGEFLLISRRNKQLARDVIEEINSLLRAAEPKNQTITQSTRN